MSEIESTNRWLAPAMAIALIAGVAGSPALAIAQGGVRLIPRAGLYIATVDLGQVQGVEGAVDLAKMESTLGLGLAIEFGAGETWAFRLDGVYGTRSAVPIGGVGCLGACGDARSTVAVLTGAAVLRPLPYLIPVQPYLLAGAGLKRYDFDQEDAQNEGVSAFVSDQNRLAGQLGVGVEVPLVFTRLRIEVSDLVSRFEPGGGEVTGTRKTQHDVFITLGLSF